MDREIDTLEKHIAHLREQLGHAEDKLERWMTNSSPPVGYLKITTMEQVSYWLDRRYWLCNYQPGRIALFYPSMDGGGLCDYIYGPLADELGPIYDRWNYDVYQHRMAEAA